MITLVIIPAVAGGSGRAHAAVASGQHPAVTAGKAAEFLEDLAALDIRADKNGAGRILTDVHRLAVQYRLTAYDAANLELALRRNVALATLDAALLKACKVAGVAVL